MVEVDHGVEGSFIRAYYPEEHMNGRTSRVTCAESRLSVSFKRPSGPVSQRRVGAQAFDRAAGYVDNRLLALACKPCRPVF